MNKKRVKKIVRVGTRTKNANFNDKNDRNAGGDKQSKHKVSFPCKLCKDDHLTHLCPYMKDASCGN